MVFRERFIVIPTDPAGEADKLLFRHRGELILDLDVKISDSPVHEQYADVQRFAGLDVDVTLASGKPFAPRFAQNMPVPAEYDYCRPKYRFTTRRGWINDPNGLFFYNGLWHLFYQHNPAGSGWGNMHWGHAVSSDLIHWEERGNTLFPDRTGTMFSGSAFVDHKNASGLGDGSFPPILLYYTAAGGTSLLSKDIPFTQCMAYSADGGESFVKYSGNPILPHVIGANRDPKVVYSPELGLYVMALFLDGCTYGLFTSKNLLDWTELQRIDLPGDGECPDFYPLEVEGEPDSVKWVLSGASDRYFVGSLGESGFVPEQPIMPQRYTDCSYAAQTYDNAGGRRVKLAWGRITHPGCIFASRMSTPWELSLVRRCGRLYLAAQPTDEYLALRRVSKTYEASAGFETELPEGPYDLKLTCPTGSEDIRLMLGSSPVAISPKGNQMILREGGSSFPLTLEGGDVEIQLFADTGGVEVLCDGGIITAAEALTAGVNGKLKVLSGSANLTISEIIG